MKIEISICTGLMLNDHSNPYIESTTVLSDTQLPIYLSDMERNNIKGNDAIYKELNLGNVTGISHVSTEKEFDYRSVALALIRLFAVVRAVLT